MTARPGTTGGHTSGEPIPLVIAPMRSRDLRSVLAIERAVFPRPWSHRLFADELAQRATRLYRTAWVGRKVVGFGGVMFVEDDAHVNTIAVDPAWHGCHIGTAVLADLVTGSLARGAHRLSLEVRVGNEPALALYRRFGMAPVGVRPNYYPETGDDALVMVVEGIDEPAYAERLGAIGDEVAERVVVDARS
ncbi:MAG: ribosomal protein S18-alanine N-acetyltransferase [Acidimicrobiales bacterium]